MKSIKKILGIGLITPLLTGVGTLPEKNYSVVSNIIARPTNTSDQTLTLCFSTDFFAYIIELVVRAYNHKNNTLLYKETYTVRVSGTTEQSLDVTIPLAGKLNGNGLRIEFECTSKGDKKTSAAVLYPYIKKTINVKNYRHERYEYNNVLLKFDNHKFYTDEYIDFTNLNEYLALKEGNILDLSNISFKYDKNIGFECGTATLHIKDYKNVFSEIDKTNNEIVFDMKANTKEDEIFLTLDEELYVNEKTLEISKIFKKGCVATDSIYIPVGKELLFEEDEIYITIDDAGYSQTDIVMPFNYFFSNREIGQCYESDYCISGGIRE